MTKHAFGIGGAVVIASVVCGALAAGCGDDAAALGGCGTDVDCKGDRICVDGECVDPETAGGAGGVGAAGGDGGSSGREDGGGIEPRDPNQPIDDPALEAACMQDCEARIAADCEMNTFSLDQCAAQCLVVDEQNRGYCLDELRERYSCLADGGYSCVTGYASPKSTCIAESQALNDCSVDIPCLDFCDQTGGGCATDEAACVTDCQGQMDAMQLSSCYSDYTILLNCWATQTAEFSCQDGLATVGDCGQWIARTADCVGRRGESCDGWCWAAETLGCGDGCAEDCAAKIADSSCGYYFESVISCAIERSDLQLECSDGVPAATADCASDVMNYESCITP